MSTITVCSSAHEEVVDITEEVAKLALSMNDGLCHLFVQHTTCALTILTNEKGIAEDLLTVLHGLVPQTRAYVHDSADHVRAGRLAVGKFQRIVLVEFEGPRERTIEVSG